MTPGVRLFLAEEHEYLAQEPDGEAHYLDAEREALACIEEATAQTSLDRRERILRDCTNLRDRMNQRLVHVQLRLARPAPPGVQVLLDGIPLRESEWGRTWSRLPGREIEVIATAPGRVTFRRVFRPMSPVSEVVEVELPEVQRVLEQRVVQRSSAAPLRIAGGLVAGIGAVMSAVGVWQAIVTRNQAALTSTADARSADPVAQSWFYYENTVNVARRLDAEQLCQLAARDAVSNPDAARVQNLCDANSTSRTLAYVFGVGGAVLVGTGVTLLVLSAVTRSRTTPVALSPVPLRGGTGIALEGSF